LSIENKHQAKHQGEKSYEGEFGFHGFSSSLAISLPVALRKGYLAAEPSNHGGSRNALQFK
jgi:hypothetical protein